MGKVVPGERVFRITRGVCGYFQRQALISFIAVAGRLLDAQSVEELPDSVSKDGHVLSVLAEHWPSMTCRAIV